MTRFRTQTASVRTSRPSRGRSWHILSAWSPSRGARQWARLRWPDEAGPGTAICWPSPCPIPHSTKSVCAGRDQGKDFSLCRNSCLAQRWGPRDQVYPWWVKSASSCLGDPHWYPVDKNPQGSQAQTVPQTFRRNMIICKQDGMCFSS